MRTCEEAVKCLLVFAALAMGLVQGCATQQNRAAAGAGGSTTVTGSGRPIAQGTIFSARFKRSDDSSASEGFTRLNDPHMVPGSSGAWNVDAYGTLYHDYLIIVYPQEKDLGPKVIPASRIIEIQFGDGGIRQVDKKNKVY
jgi:hypothetical protein